MITPTDFISRWTLSGNSERGCFRRFLGEFCDALTLPRPDPAKTTNEENTYSFERKVYVQGNEGAKVLKRLDLYRHGCFVLEAKQGRDAAALLPGQTSTSAPARGSRQWHDMMIRGWKQAEHYARCLPHGERRPPFVIVVDVGYCFDCYAEFSCTGGLYLHYPDPKNHRIMLADLNKSVVQDRLRAIWLDPMSLDLSRRAAKVTEEVAGYLALLARSLEADGHDPAMVSQFLMCCIIAMFAEHMHILAENSFTDMLGKCMSAPETYALSMRNLWEEMNCGGWSFVSNGCVQRFNGKLFANPQILSLRREQLSVMLQAARADWRVVEPAIFGTLIERALDPKERHKLGAHYTPRAYVERLVIPTIMKPLREEWDNVQTAARVVFESGKETEACKIVHKYHDRLCKVSVLDPACGSGNFLYVTMEHMKRLEDEVLETLASYGEKHLSHSRVDLHQFSGLEINPRAANFAEIVLWIGYLQWHLKTYGDVKPPEPVVRVFSNIQCKDALISYDSWKYASDENGKPIERWDGETYKTDPVTGQQIPDESATKLDMVYEGVTAAVWPKADYIIGNPPFIAGKDKRRLLGDGYTRALFGAFPNVPKSCDLVMNWWHRAAEMVRDGETKRFGFITTNSITQVFHRRVLSSFLEDKQPLHMAFAIPDHPWVDACVGATVRIALTVVAKGRGEGVLAKVVSESCTEGRESAVTLRESFGTIHADMSHETSFTTATRLASNRDLCTRGMLVCGSGFIITPKQASTLGLGRLPGLERFIRPHLNGRDFAQSPRGVLAIDFFGLTASEVRNRYPEAYQWLLTRVKPVRDHNKLDYRRRNWWLFGSTNTELRDALACLSRFVATPLVAKHRVFSMFPTSIIPDSCLVATALSDAYHLGVLSSRVHAIWAITRGGTLESRPIYNTTVCFSTFPFPDATSLQQLRIRNLGEALDTHRKKRMELHPELSISSMYNVLDSLRAGRDLAPREKNTHDKGLVSVLRKLHDDLDTAVADAYGWPIDLPDEEILSRLVALNAERAEEERNGLVRWLRPEFQTQMKEQHAAFRAKISFGSSSSTESKKPKQTKNESPAEKQPWPSDLLEQIQAVGSAVKALQADGTAVNVDTIIKHFARAPRTRVEEITRSLEWLGLVRPFGNTK